MDRVRSIMRFICKVLLAVALIALKLGACHLVALYTNYNFATLTFSCFMVDVWRHNYSQACESIGGTIKITLK